MTHANVLNFAGWVRSRFGVTSDDILTNVNPMYFDNSVFDFYGALLNGAAIAPVTRDVVADSPAMLDQLEAAAATIWFSVPSLLIYLTTLKLLAPERLPSIRTFVFGGEGYPKPELRKLQAAFGSRSELVNVYGPTECTCICSAWNVSAADLEDPAGLVTLGPVAANFAMVVLDDQDRAVGPGGVGELGLLGPQVGLGYVNDPERTAVSFTRNPANELWAERMYRTGDLVRVGDDGRRLDFVGRKDNQIKHMGYRIELEEIEAALHQIEGISEAAVVQIAGRRDLKMLVAYIAADREHAETDLRERLAERLPAYMIPQRFERRAFLPKNANGKIDRRALAADGV
jgi:D-alanine--poly(phosphoribitol) ligase subunit 1